MCKPTYPNPCFAALQQSIPVNKSISDDISAFQNTAARFNPDHLKTADGLKQYFPIFTQIQGIKEVQSLDYDKNIRQSYYQITEGKNYTLESRIFLKKPPGCNSTLEIKCNEKQFVNAPFKIETVASPYDQFAWRITPAKVAKDVLVVINIQSKVNAPSDIKNSSLPNLDVLDINLPIYLLIKFDRGLRFVETMQDIGIAIATILIAGVGLLQKIDASNPMINIILIFAASVFCLGIMMKVIWQWRGK